MRIKQWRNNLKKFKIPTPHAYAAKNKSVERNVIHLQTSDKQIFKDNIVQTSNSNNNEMNELSNQLQVHLERLTSTKNTWNNKNNFDKSNNFKLSSLSDLHNPVKQLNSGIKQIEFLITLFKYIETSEGELYYYQKRVRAQLLKNTKLQKDLIHQQKKYIKQVKHTTEMEYILQNLCLILTLDNFNYNLINFRTLNEQICLNNCYKAENFHTLPNLLMTKEQIVSIRNSQKLLTSGQHHMAVEMIKYSVNNSVRTSLSMNKGNSCALMKCNLLEVITSLADCATHCLINYENKLARQCVEHLFMIMLNIQRKELNEFKNSNNNNSDIFKKLNRFLSKHTFNTNEWCSIFNCFYKICLIYSNDNHFDKCMKILLSLMNYTCQQTILNKNECLQMNYLINSLQCMLANSVVLNSIQSFTIRSEMSTSYLHLCMLWNEISLMYMSVTGLNQNSKQSSLTKQITSAAFNLWDYSIEYLAYQYTEIGALNDLIMLIIKRIILRRPTTYYAYSKYKNQLPPIEESQNRVFHMLNTILLCLEADSSIQTRIFNLNDTSNQLTMVMSTFASEYLHELEIKMKAIAEVELLHQTDVNIIHELILSMKQKGTFIITTQILDMWVELCQDSCHQKLLRRQMIPRRQHLVPKLNYALNFVNGFIEEILSKRTRPSIHNINNNNNNNEYEMYNFSQLLRLPKGLILSINKIFQLTDHLIAYSNKSDSMSNGHDSDSRFFFKLNDDLLNLWNKEKQNADYSSDKIYNNHPISVNKIRQVWLNENAKCYNYINGAKNENGVDIKIFTAKLTILEKISKKPSTS
uniref:Uncharacterized protein n=1 Tax=Trichobilharzia regenti TaxID=157069 RepID=A0AA85KKF3_TRIRE|nr:unnamed protein product [Trichobilharzia regenti]